MYIVAEPYLTLKAYRNFLNQNLGPYENFSMPDDVNDIINKLFADNNIKAYRHYHEGLYFLTFDNENHYAMFVLRFG